MKSGSELKLTPVNSQQSGNWLLLRRPIRSEFLPNQAAHIDAMAALVGGDEVVTCA